MQWLIGKLIILGIFAPSICRLGLFFLRLLHLASNPYLINDFVLFSLFVRPQSDDDPKQLVHDIIFVAEDLVALFGERNAWRWRSNYLDGSGLIPVEVQRRADHIEKLGLVLGDATNEVSYPAALVSCVKVPIDFPSPPPPPFTRQHVFRQPICVLPISRENPYR